jgi:hypothetical protein
VGDKAYLRATFSEDVNQSSRELTYIASSKTMYTSMPNPPTVLGKRVHG